MAASSGSIVTRKIGPLPAWAWFAIVAAGVFLYSRRNTGAAAAQASTVSAATPDTSSGLVPSAGSASGGSGSTDALLSAYGSQQSALLDALTASESNVLQLAQSQLAYNASQTTNGAIDTSTGATVGSQPGGSGAPTFNFSFPGITNATTTAKTAVTNTATAVKAPTVTRYYTYKANVPLASGQTVHFLSGKGYYAA